METRVLTLFDDDFFSPEPPKEKLKKEKAAKNEINTDEDEDSVKREEEVIQHEVDVASTEPSIFKEEDIPVTAFESERLVDDKIPVNESVFADFKNPEGHAVTIHDAAFEPERLVDDKVPVNESVFIEHAEAKEHSESIKEDINPVSEFLRKEDDNAMVDRGISDASEEAALNESAPIELPDTGKTNDAAKELNQQILSELIQLDYTALMQKDYAFDLNSATVINKELPKRKDEPVVEVQEEIEEEEVFEEATPLPEWNLDKKYYTIGEVAALFTVNTSHIRFWTNEFKLRPRTTRKGDRLYSPKDIAELRLIHHLVKEKKHTIKGAREKLKAEKTGVNNKLDLKESLVQLRDTLLKIKEQL